MLELKNISFKRDNKTILNNINLTLEDNKFYCISAVWASDIINFIVSLAQTAVENLH